LLPTCYDPAVKLRSAASAGGAAAAPRPRHRGLAVVLVVALLTALLQTASAAPSRPFRAPGDLQESAVTRSSMLLRWAAVPGAPGYRVRLWSEGNATVWVSTRTNSANVRGLKPNTLYYVRANVEQPATATTEAKRLSDNSPENQVTTSTYARRTPDGLKAGRQTPTSVGLSWNPVGDLKAGDRYVVEYALDIALTLSRRTAGPFTSASATLGSLANNTSYFARVHVVNAKGTRISGSSEIVEAKSLVPRGTIAGTTSGAPAGDLLAVAYDRLDEVAAQGAVRSDGTYALKVRPGSYRVQVQYVGTAGLTTRWARTGSAGSTVKSAATPVTVAFGKTAAAPAVKLARGANVAGTVKDPAGKVVRDVDVTALSAVTAEREVVAVTRSTTGYTLSGLPDGAYWLRFVYSGDGFTPRSVKLAVKGGSGRTIRVDATLPHAVFRAQYKPRISGTKTVGRTLTAAVTPWLAGSYPTTRASMSLQWLRNGAAIPGATATTYRLTRTDRGKKISVRATGRRYGYATASTTSAAYTVS
jgi:hypothetical protein